MPPTPSVPNLARVDVHFLVGTDSAALSRFHMTYLGSPPSGGDMAAFAAALDVTCAADTPAVMRPDTNYGGVVITDLSSPIGAIGAAATVSVGTRAGGPLPASACALA